MHLANLELEKHCCLKSNTVLPKDKSRPSLLRVGFEPGFIQALSNRKSICHFCLARLSQTEVTEFISATSTASTSKTSLPFRTLISIDDLPSDPLASTGFSTMASIRQRIRQEPPTVANDCIPQSDELEHRDSGLHTLG